MDKSKKKNDYKYEFQRLKKPIGKMISFFRRHPHIFVKVYFDIDLELFQQVILCEMFKGDYTGLVMCRGAGKTYLVAVFALAYCVLYPGTKVVVAAGVKKQSTLVLKKIIDDLKSINGFGSANISREILSYNVKGDNGEIIFHNGSRIDCVPASDNARGYRGNILIVDEFRLVKNDMMSSVLMPILSVRRMPPFLKKEKYKNLSLKEKEKYYEENKTILMSSAWYKAHWSYDKALDMFEKMLTTDTHSIMALPYQAPLRAGYGSKKIVQQQVTEKGYDPVIFEMEYIPKFHGQKGGGFFSIESVQMARELEHPYYKKDERKILHTSVPPVPTNGRRILSVDIALMKGQANDATCIMINDARPTDNNFFFEANIIYIETHEGWRTQDIALLIRKLYKEFKCTDIAIDASGNGLGVFDLLVSDIVDTENGEVYPALNCINDPTMAARCKVPNAQKVVWSIKGSRAMNTEIHKVVRRLFNDNRIKLLTSVDDAGDILKSKLGAEIYNAMIDSNNIALTNLLMPYVETDLLMKEILQLKTIVNNNDIKLVEDRSGRKDRYSALSYNCWVMNELELQDLRKPKVDTSVQDYIKGLKKVSKKINYY